MCGGRLEIKRSDDWTVAEIIIPKAQEVTYDNGNT